MNKRFILIIGKKVKPAVSISLIDENFNWSRGVLMSSGEPIGELDKLTHLGKLSNALDLIGDSVTILPRKLNASNPHCFSNVVVETIFASLFLQLSSSASHLDKDEICPDCSRGEFKTSSLKITV